MKKCFATLAACAMALACFSSCQKADVQEQQPVFEAVRHSVTFNPNVEDLTKTSLLIKIVPSWKNTLNSDLYLYESHLGYMIKGENCEIIPSLEDNYEKATFTAEFNMDIIVEPTKADYKNVIQGYRYGGIVAQSSEGKFILPSIQYPEAEPFIDPRADFLVGDSRNEYEDTRHGDVISMYFTRPVALSRLAITNVDGTKINSVKITSDDVLAADATFDDIDFETGEVNFDLANGSKTLTLSYADGLDIEGTTYVYFISLAGKKAIKEIEVVTDEWVYTKTVGKNTTFDCTNFKNIALDLTIKEGNNVTRKAVGETKLARNLSFDPLEVTLTAGDTFESVLKGVKDGGVTYSSNKTDIATVDANGKVTAVAAGEATITASAAANETYLAGEASFKVIVNAKPAAKQDRGLAFNGSPLNVMKVGDTFEIKLYGETSDITFSSNAPEVASVDENGKVTAVAAGEATITISAPETDEFKADQLSYKLAVEAAPAPSEDKTYTKVSAITAGKNYVIVTGNNALQNDNGSPKAYSVSGKISGNTLTLTATESASVEWLAASTTSSKGEFTFANNGKYASRVTGTNVLECASSAGDRAAWTLSGTQMYNLNSSNDKYYLNYSSQWQATTGGSSAVIAIYQEGEGGGSGEVDPPTPPVTTVTYTKLASNASIADGTYIIVNKTDGYALKNATNAGTSNAVAVSPAAGVITGEHSDLEFTINAVSGGYVIKSGSQFMFASASVSDTYIGYQTSQNVFKLEVSGTDLFCLKTSKGSSDSEYLYKKGSDSFFKLGGSGKPGGSDSGVYLYKKN